MDSRIIIILSCAAVVQISLSIATSVTTDTPINCGNLTCSQQSKCRNDSGDYRCQCHAGFQGKTCYEDVDECSIGYPCLHRGACHNTMGSWWCECLEGWNGTNRCEDNITEVRMCMPGWTGEWCENQCTNDSDCSPSAYCKKTHNDAHYCACKDGWYGKTCTEDRDECARNTCIHSGSCINTAGSYVCTCADGWTGTDCNADVDECAIKKCGHAYLCSNSIGSYICNCTLGWQGDDCSDDVDECDLNPCNGTTLVCQNTHGSYECVQRSKGSSSTANVGIIVGASAGAFLVILATVLTLFYTSKWKRYHRNSVADLTEGTEVGDKPFQPQRPKVNHCA